jgi:hypothetical protein
MSDFTTTTTRQCQPTLPTRSISSPRFRYVPAAKTDIRQTFARFRRLIERQQRMEASR